MTGDEREDDTIYEVVVNHEEQYSIWPADLDPVAGWRNVGQRGTEAECLAYIDQVWTDMRPLSLRRQMDGMRDGVPPGAPSRMPVASDEAPRAA
jgi:MbtH protein